MQAGWICASSVPCWPHSGANSSGSAPRSNRSVACTGRSTRVAELLKRLDAFDQRVASQASGRLDPVDEQTRELLAELPRMRREMLVELNPLLRGAEIVFVKRYTYNSKHYYDDFQHISAWGGNLCVLSLADGRVRELAPQLAGGHLRPLRSLV